MSNIHISINTKSVVKGQVAYGKRGLSAYQLWILQGNVGTEADFLAAIKGDSFVYADFTPEQLAAIKNPLDQVAANVAAAEALRVPVEATRTVSEGQRVAAENARLVFQTYNGATAYAPGNKVAYNGSSYACILASTGNLPANATYWMLIAQKGDMGLTGYSYTEKSIMGVQWNRESAPTLTRLGDAKGLSAAMGIGSAYAINDFDRMPIYRDIAEVTDVLGNVFVRIPKFYIRKTKGTGYQTWEISMFKHTGFYLPMCFWDFTNAVELDYVDVGKYQASLDGSNRLESKSAKPPLINKNIVDFRTYARANGTGYGQLDVHTLDVLQTLFLVEFATLNSQSIMLGFSNGTYAVTHVAVIAETGVNRIVIANAFAALYRVGQPISIGTSQGGNQIFYGRTITAIDVYDASNKAISFNGAPVNIAIGNMVYNTGWVSGWSSQVLAKSGTIIANDGYYPMMYRGIESLYGDVWKFVDGVSINERQAWLCDNQSSYVSNVFTAPYKQLGYVNGSSDGYSTDIGIDSANPPLNLPIAVTGGSTSTYYSDYYYQSTGQRIALCGGSWNYGAYSGLFFWYLNYSSTNTNFYIGGRLLRKAS